jgi:hypothetical protein
MKPGGCSDASRTRHQDRNLLPAGFLQVGKENQGSPAMPVTWIDWLLEKGEPDSNWYDFAEARPVWTMWWFRISATALCIGLVWFSWPFL